MLFLIFSNSAIEANAVTDLIKQDLCFTWSEESEGNTIQMIASSCETQNYHVTIKADATVFPDHAFLHVTELSENQQAYQNAYHIIQDLDANHDPVQFSALDISLYQDNIAIEPKGTINVNIAFKNLPEHAEDITLHHIHDSEPERITTIENKHSILFDTDQFSIYAITWHQKENISIKIKDTVLQDGRFLAELSGNIPEGKIIYQWYRRPAGSSDPWELIENAYGLDYHIPADPTENWLNVAYDRLIAPDSDLYEYKVIALQEDQEIAESSAMQVPYYDTIQNGGFESPDASKVAPADGGWNWNAQILADYSQNDINIAWKTTAFDNRIELIHPSADASSAKNAYGSEIIHLHDSQCAEILCNAVGALYQDILTIPGSIMYWEFYQLGRNATNMMYVVPIPTAWFDGNVVTVPEIGNYDLSTETGIADFKSEILDQNRLSGAKEATATANGWIYHNAIYTVPENQYVTRYLFLSISGTNHDPTKGNIIDDVKFSREAPAIAPFPVATGLHLIDDSLLLIIALSGMMIYRFRKGHA